MISSWTCMTFAGIPAESSLDDATLTLTPDLNAPKHVPFTPRTWQGKPQTSNLLSMRTGRKLGHVPMLNRSWFCIPHPAGQPSGMPGSLQAFSPTGRFYQVPPTPFPLPSATPHAVRASWHVLSALLRWGAPAPEDCARQVARAFACIL